MNEQEFKDLDNLFEKLQGLLNHPIALMSGIQDGVTIAIYNKKTGIMLNTETSYDVPSCVKKQQEFLSTIKQ